MVGYYQGDILKIENYKDYFLVVSKDIYNETGQVIVCPIVKVAKLLPIIQEISFEGTKQYVLCDQMKKLNMGVRGSKRIGQISIRDRMEISDIIQGLFEY